MSAHSKAEIDAALERMADVTLGEQLGRESTLSRDLADQVADAVVGDPAPESGGGGHRLWTALLVAAGIAVVALVGWQASRDTEPTREPEGGVQAGPEAGGQQPGDPEPPAQELDDDASTEEVVDNGRSQRVPDPVLQEPKPQEPASSNQGDVPADGDQVLPKTMDELRALLPQVARVECRALRYLGRSDASDRQELPWVAGAGWITREVKRTFGDLQRTGQAAAHAWPNEIRLVLEDGRFVSFCYAPEIRHMSFAGLGDVEYHPALQKVFNGLIKDAEWAARRRFGVVERTLDLRKEGADGYPADIQTLVLTGPHAFDLARVARFGDLRRLWIVGETPSRAQQMDFGALTGLLHLQEVTIRHGKLYRHQLAELAKLPSLRTLDLEYAVIQERDVDAASSIMPPSPWGELARCETLETLKCGYAQPMDNRAMDAIQEIQSLRHLDLSGRSIGTVSAQDLSGLDALTNLRVLRLSQVPLDLNPLLSALRDAGTQLEVLDLSDTRLDDRGAGRIGSFQALRELDASRCGDLGADGLQSICAGRPLKRLKLKGCRQIPAGELARALEGATDTLQVLDLEQTSYTDEAVGVLRQMGDLRQLDLSFTQAGDKSLTWLVHLGTLERLELTGVKGLTDEALRAVTPKTVTTGSQGGIGLGSYQFRGLRYLDVSLCDGLSEEVVRAFAAARPECTVRASQFGMR